MAMFGSSFRQGRPFVEPEVLPNPAPVAAAPAVLADPAQAKPREYLGGLIKYAPPKTGPGGLQTFGATMQDIGASLTGGQGGNLERVQEAYRQRQAEAEKKSVMDRLQAMAGDLYPDDEEAQLLFKADPSAFVEERLKARQPEKPVLVNTRLGPRLYHPKTGEYETLEDIPEKLPFGWSLDENGNPQIDPQFVAGQGALSNARAAATAAHRAPPRGRSGGGSSGGGSPSGASAVPPWKRKW